MFSIHLCQENRSCLQKNIQNNQPNLLPLLKYHFEIIAIPAWNMKKNLPSISLITALSVKIKDAAPQIAGDSRFQSQNCGSEGTGVPYLMLKQYFCKERYLGKKWLMEFLRFWEKCRGIKWYKVIFRNSSLVLDAQLSYLKHDSKTHHKRSNSEEATPHQLPPPSIQFCFVFHIRRLWNAIHWWIQDLLHVKVKQGSKALECCATCARKKHQ